MVAAVVFDLDGLLVDSEPVWFRVREEMFARYGLVWTYEDQMGLMGRNTQWWVDAVTEKLGGRLDAGTVKSVTLEGMVRNYREGLVPVMPGAQEALEYCAARWPLGLASGSPQLLIDAALEANGWRRYFRETLSTDDVPRGKPAPDAYLQVLGRLSIAPADAVIAEDSGSGILAGKAAGARVAAVPNPALMPAPEALKSAHIVLGSLHQLPGYLEGLALVRS